MVSQQKCCLVEISNMKYTLFLVLLLLTEHAVSMSTVKILPFDE